MKPRFNRFLAASITTLAAIAFSSSASAAILYWDGGTVTANGISAGGTGTWTVGAAGWEDGVSAQNWTNGNDAVLGGTAGTVTLGGAISATSVSVNTTGYTLALNNLALTTGALNYGGAANGSLTITGNLTTAGTTNAMNVITLSGAGTGWAAGTSVNLTGQGNPAVGSTHNGALAKLVFGTATALGSAEIKVKHGMIQAGAAGMTITNAITNAGASLYFGGENDFTVSGLVKNDSGSDRTIGVWVGSTTSRTITLTNMDTNGRNFNFEARGSASNPNPLGGFIVNGVISGTGGINTVGSTQFVGNTVTLNGANTYTGATGMLSGTFKAGIASVADVSGAFGKNSAVSISGGTIDLNGFNTQIGSLAGAGGTMALNSAAILSTGGTNTATTTSFGGLISGTGGLTKIGIGTQTLTNAANSFSGNVVINGGILEGNGSSSNINSTLGLSSGSRTITVNNTGTLKLASTNVFGGGSQTLANTTKVVINSGGTMTTAAFNVIGNIDLNGGTLTATGGTSAAYQAYEFNGSTVTVGGTTASTISASGTTNGFHIAGTKTLTLSVGDVAVGTDLTISAALINGSNDRGGNGAVLKSGLGTAALTGNNSYSGGTTLSAGTLAVNSATSLGASAGALTFSGNSTLQALATFSSSRTTTINTGITGTIDTNGFNLTKSGVVSGLGSLVKDGAGTLTLSGTNTYQGGTSLKAGTLEVTDAASLGNTSGALTFAGNSTLKILGSLSSARNYVVNTGVTGSIDTNSFNLTQSGTLTGAGALTKLGAGTLTLSGGGSYSGAITLSDGGLTVNSTLAGVSSFSIAAGKTLGVGNSGQLTTGSMTFDGAGIINFGDIGNYASNPAINVTGALTLNGGAGGVTLNLGTGIVSAGTFHLIGTSLGSLSGFTLGTTPTLSARQSGALTLNTGFVDYVVSGVNPSWTGALSSEWSTATLAEPKNWVLPGGGGTTDYIAGDIVIFDDSATGTGVDIAADVSPTSVAFSNVTKDYTLTGTAGIAGSSTLTKSGAGTVTINNANSYSGATAISAGTIIVGNAGAFGTSIVGLNGGTINIGSTTVANAFTLGGGAITANGGTLSGVISGSGALIKNGAGTLTLSNTNTYSGGTTLNAGTLAVNSATSLGNTSGALTFAGNSTLQTLATFSTARNFVLNTGITGIIDTNGFNLTQSGIISGAGSLTKASAGTLQLSGNNTFSGNVLVSGGELQTSGTNNLTALGSNAVGRTITINSGATLKFMANDTFGNASANPNPSLIINGTVTNATTAFTTVGAVTLNNGSLISTGGAGGGYQGFSLSSSVTATGTSTMSSSGANSNFHLGTNTSFDVTGASDLLTVSGVLMNRNNNLGGAGGLTKTGAGTMRLTGNNIFTGNVNIDNGILDITTNGIYRNADGSANFNPTAVVTINAGGTLKLNAYDYNGVGGTGGLRDQRQARVLNGGTIEVVGATHTSGNDFTVNAAGGNFRYNPADTANTLTLAGNGNTNIQLDGTLTYNTVGNITVTEAMDGTGGITKTGAGTLTFNSPSTGTGNSASANTYTGVTTISNGTLQLGDGTTGKDGIIAGASIVNNANLTYNRFGSVSYGGVISGSGSVTKTGAGTQTLTGTNTYGGATNVNVGKLVINGDNSGATGAVTVASGATLAGSGTVGGATTIQSGGIHGPGNSPGVQTFSSDLTYSSGSIFSWDLASATESGRGTNFDGVNVTGGLTIDSTASTGSIFQIVLGTSGSQNDAFWNTSRSWNVYNVTGSITGAFTNFSVVDSSFAAVTIGSPGSFTFNGGTGALNWSAVPEPSSVLAGLLLGAGLLRRRRVA